VVSVGAGREAPVAEDGVGAAPVELSAGERAEILNSARNVVAQEGVEKFTLSAVAREASVARNALYGQFHNKNELLVAIAADDLAHAARAMGGDKTPAPKPLSHAELVSALVDKVDHPDRPNLPAETIVPGREPLTVLVRDTSSVREEATPMPPPETEAVALQPAEPVELLPAIAKKRGEAQQLSEIINRLTLPQTELGEGSAQALTRVDRRMTMVEKALAELEGRFDKFAKGANDSFQTTETSLESLVQRAERTDQRISETATTLRGEMLAAFTRIEIPPTEPPRVTPPPAEASDEIAVSDMSAETQPAGDLRSQLKIHTANDDHHGQGRQFAGADTASVQSTTTTVRKRRRQKHLLSNTQLFGIGAISIAVILATMGIALSEGFIDVKHAHIGAPAPVARAATSAPQRMAIATPQVEAHEPVAVTAPKPAAVIAPPVKLTPMQRLEALANGGNAKAAVILGVKYLDGDGVSRSEQDAARWLDRAAKSGEPVAEYRLGTLYQRGAGVVQDEAQALRWYEAAANQGNRKAMHNLGVFYAEGRGTTQDYEKAASWFLRAANMGYVDSQFDLAVLYERGAGVPQNLSDAYKWYAIAARNGDDVSKARIDVLETQLDPGELSSAKAAAHAFRATSISRAANMTPLLADLSPR
jgi:AcrR family transcriptional regulator